MTMTMSRAYLLMFSMAAVLGTFYDLIHVRFGVLSYTTPHVWGTSLWVPLEFGVAGLLGVTVLRALSRHLVLPQVTLRRTVFDGLLLLVGYFVTGVFAGDNIKTFAILIPLALVSVVTRPNRFVFISSLLIAAIGPLGEIFMSQGLGFFNYNVAELIPVWLPMLWVIAGGLFVDIPILVLSGLSLANPNGNKGETLWPSQYNKTKSKKTR